MTFASAYQMVAETFPGLADMEPDGRCGFGTEVDPEALAAAGTLEWFVRHGFDTGKNPAPGVLARFLSEGGAFHETRLDWAVGHLPARDAEAALIAAMDFWTVPALLGPKGAYATVRDRFGAGIVSPEGFRDFLEALRARAESAGSADLDCWLAREYPRMKAMTGENGL